MKLFIHILLFYFTLGACIPKGDFSQLLKLDDMMEHYELHQKEALAIGETICFSEFIYLHFLDADEHQHENEDDHNNLPFQSISSSITFHLDLQETIPVFSPDFSKRLIPFYGAVFQEGITFNIFHPPSIA